MTLFIVVDGVTHSAKRPDLLTDEERVIMRVVQKYVDSVPEDKQLINSEFHGFFDDEHNRVTIYARNFDGALVNVAALPKE